MRRSTRVRIGDGLMPPRTPYNMLMTAPVLRWIPPERTALLLLDAQHYATSRDRGLGAEAELRGIRREFDEYYEQAEVALGNMAVLLGSCRAFGVTVIHSVMVAEPDGVSPQLLEAALPLPTGIADEIRPEVLPVDGEVVLARGAYSPFLNQALEQTLRAAGIERVIVAGMMANIVVTLAAREAADRGFGVIVVHDASASETLEWHGLTMLGIGGGGIRVLFRFEVVEMLEGTRL